MASTINNLLDYITNSGDIYSFELNAKIPAGSSLSRSTSAFMIWNCSYPNHLDEGEIGWRKILKHPLKNDKGGKDKF